MPKRSPTMRLQRAAHAVAVVARRDEHVRGQRGEARGDLPDVQVVDLDHAGHGGQRVADGLGIDALGRALEQHAAGVAQQQPARAQHDRGHQQRGDRVGAVEAREEHDRAGRRGGERREEVGEHVRAGALDVQRAPLGLAQRGGGADVRARADEADDEHEAAVDLGGRPQAPDRLDGDDARQHEQRRAVGLGREDLGAAEAEGEAPGGRPRGQPGGVQRDARSRPRR